MATFEGPEIATNGTTPVDVVTNSTGEAREVINVLAFNRDTVAHVMILKKVNGTITPWEVGRVDLAAGEGPKAMLLAPVVLDGNTEKLTIESDATATTTEPFVHPAVFKVP